MSSLIIIQSPLQYLSFCEAREYFELGDCTLIFEACGNIQNERQVRQLIENDSHIAESYIISHSNTEQAFSAHLALIAKLKSNQFRYILMGHIHQWMRDFVVFHPDADVILIDDGMEMLMICEQLRENGLNLRYAQINPAFLEQDSRREQLGLNAQINNKIQFFSFLQLGEAERLTQHHWPILFRNHQVKPANEPVEHYFLGQGSWVARKVISLDDYLQYVLLARDESREPFFYVPHRWDPVALTRAIESAGIERVSFRKPWELFIRDRRHPFSVSTFNSTSALTSLYSPVCDKVISYDFQSKINSSTLSDYVKKSIVRSYDYLKAEMQHKHKLTVLEC